ncbi:MAG: hypothetical protein ABIX28_07790 [Vicinamibacterales bacterium]
MRDDAISGDKTLPNGSDHLACLVEAMSAETPALFASYVAWARVVLGARNIPAQELARHLELMRTVLRELLPPTPAPWPTHMSGPVSRSSSGVRRRYRPAFRRTHLTPAWPSGTWLHC